MVEKRFRISLPEELLSELGWRDTEVPHRVREALVMDLVRLDKVSEATAAKLLGLDRWTLLETMGKHHVPAVRMSPGQLRKELRKGINRGLYTSHGQW